MKRYRRIGIRQRGGGLAKASRARVFFRVRAREGLERRQRLFRVKDKKEISPPAS